MCKLALNFLCLISRRTQHCTPRSTPHTHDDRLPEYESNISN